MGAMMRNVYNELRFGVAGILAGRTGARFYVSSVTGTSGKTGRDRTRAKATVAQAIALCTANQGDTIICLPGHVEAVPDAVTVALSKAGVALIGMGIGSLIPTFTLGTATAATIDVPAGCTNNVIAGIKVVSDLADVAAGISATATSDGLQVLGCEFRDGGLTKELKVGVLIAAACNNCRIIGNNFVAHYAADTGATDSAIKLVGESLATEIVGNFAYGHYVVSCLDGGTAAANELLIAHNNLGNIDSGAGLALKAHANTTGFCHHNNVYGGKNGTSAISAAAMLCFENRMTNAAGATGVVSPANDA